MKLQEFIKFYENVLDSDFCDHIIYEFKNKSEHITYYNNQHYKFEQLNLNTCGSEKIAKSFIHKVIPYIQEYTESLGFQSYIKIRGFEHVRIKKYLKGSDYRFDTHVDVDDKDSCVRYLTFILYLNDNNGHTTFPYLDLSFKPKKGSMIMFPPFWMFPHSGETPKDTDKYIIMSSLHYS